MAFTFIFYIGVQMNFFSEHKNLKILREAHDSLPTVLNSIDETSFQYEMVINFKTMLEAIIANPSFWDEHSSFSIKILGERFISLLGRIFPIKNEFNELFQLAYAMNFRFIYEGFLLSNAEFEPELFEAIAFTKNNVDRFETKPASNITFSTRDLPAYLFKAMMNDPAIKNLKHINATIENAKVLTADWENTLTKKIEKAEALKASIEKYENAFNFVGLYDGFNLLHQQKKKERSNLIGMMVLSILLIMSPLVYKMYSTFKHEQELRLSSLSYELILNGSSNKPLENKVSKNESPDLVYTITSLFPTISYIAILLYLFRVLLFNYKSVCAQLLQIELRMTLCRFIMHYSDYAAKIKENSDITLDRFESVIFAGIVSNEGDLPATFDGIDQITALFKSVKTN
ncbi:hypothetical protein B565_2472 [Aeromonas veronii B565]|nr:hypothetical protein B565_2472 [Aeromonas veronii B565]